MLRYSQPVTNCYQPPAAPPATSPAEYWPVEGIAVVCGVTVVPGVTVALTATHPAYLVPSRTFVPVPLSGQISRFF